MERGAAPELAAEAIERRDHWLLLAAGVDASLARAGVCYLLIKGAVPDLRGLRLPKHSADLDVLVHPDQAQAALAALGAWGWASTVTTAGQGVRAPHAETLVHPGWSVSIDMHHRFPGFTDGAVRAFEVLWESREPIDAAGGSVAAPGRVGAALVESLNAMRSAAPVRGVEGARAAGRDAIVALSPDERDQLEVLASRAGAYFAMAPVLGHRTVPPSRADELAWDLALAGAGPFEARAAADLYSGHGWARLAALARILWPPRDEFVTTYGLDHASRVHILAARLARAGRGIVKFPQGLSRMRRLARRSASG